MYKFRVVIDLGSRREYVPFNSEWAANIYAERIGPCAWVEAR